MNQRFILALILTAIVIVVTPLIFSTPQPTRPVFQKQDSVETVRARPETLSSKVSAPLNVIGSTSAKNRAETRLQSRQTDTISVRSRNATYVFSTLGATPVSIALDSYPSQRQAAGARVRAPSIIRARDAIAHYWLVLERDTIALDTITFHAQEIATPIPAITFSALAGAHDVQLNYSLAADSADEYLMHVTATVSNAPAGAVLLIGLPKTLISHEADTLDDLNHLAVSYRPAQGDVQSVSFSSLDSAEVKTEVSPVNWVAARNKYFLVVFRAAKTPFSWLRLEGAPRQGKIAANLHGLTALPIAPNIASTFDIYAGPQSFERLQRLGGDLDQVNPYAGWMHGAVQPFATIVMRALLWMKRTTQLNYGWVLVLFGIMVRLVLWPLNQGAMRTSMKMQRLQPELQAIQKKFKEDPKKQQEAIMKVYKDHDMSPMSPLMGCLPMLLPMPVLFALYYVFQNTIEFRGVSFLWLPDISLRDPYYITPLLMGVSMFVMSWIGMRNAPPNPQAKMMTYMMPVMLTVLFLNFASGLNLYYAVQNIAALPQQWLLARERARPPVGSAMIVGERHRT